MLCAAACCCVCVLLLSVVVAACLCPSLAGERPLGVYALYDERHNLQYVGYSRNIVLAVKVCLCGGGRASGGVC